MRRIAAITVLLVIIINSYSVNAVSETLLYNESFNSYATNERPALNISSNDYYIYGYQAEEKGLYINLSPKKTAFTLPAATDGDFCISFDLMGHHAMFEGGLMLYDNSKASIELLSFTYDGDILLHDGKRLAGYGLSSMVNIIVAFRIEEKTYDVFVNNKKAVSKWKLPILPIKNLASAQIVCRSINEGSGVVLDNLNINQGNVPFDKYPKSKYNPIVTELSEITSSDTSKIFVNMDYEKAGRYTLPNGNSNYLEVMEEEGNHYLFIEKTTKDQIMADYSFSTEADSLVSEIDFKIIGEGTAFEFANVMDSNGVWIEAVKINSLAVMANNNFIAGLKIGKWYNIACVFRFGHNSYDIYLDGQMIAEGIKYSQDFSTPTKMRFFVRSGNIVSPNKFCIDNYHIYEGDEQRDLDITFSLKQENSIFPSDNDKKALLKNKVGLHLRSGVINVDGNKKMMSAKPYFIEDTAMVDAKEIASALNMEYSFDENTGNISIGEGVQLTVNNTVMKVAAETRDLSVAPEVKEEKVFIPLVEVAEGLNKKVYVDGTSLNSGLVIISDTAFIPPNSETDLQELNDYMFYFRPSAEEIKEIYKQNNSEPQHPRIFATQADIDILLKDAEIYDVKKQAVKGIIEQGDKALMAAATPSNYAGTESDAETIIRNRYPEAVKNLAFAYGLTKDKKYADKAYEHIKALCSWSNWGSHHYLNVAAGTIATAIAYDWMYDAFTPEQRKVIEEGVYDNSLEEAEQWYYGFKGTAERWAMAENNWNIVCNGSTAVTAIAFMDVYPDVCARNISNALRGLEYSIDNYAPAGLWYEGPGYWNYATSHLVYTIDSLEKSLNSDFGLADIEGLENTMNYVFHVQSPLGMFNFADSGNGGKLYASFMHWFAKKYNKPEISNILVYQNKNTTLGIEGALWYDADLGAKLIDLDKDAYFHGRTELVTSRESWADPQTTYLAMKGGEASREHSHLDIGTFIFDSDGVRWAAELGGESYTLGGYWDMALGRWNTLRTRAEGHNTIVINPGIDPRDHNLQSYGKFIRYESKSKGMISVLDMSQALSDDATDARRGYFFTDDRQSAVVRDEITLKQNSDVWWMMYTKATEAEINGNTVILKTGNKKIKLEYLCNMPAEVVFEDAKPLPGTPVVAGQNENKEFKRFALKVKGSGKVNITVKLTPFNIISTDISEYDKNMDGWVIPDGELSVKPFADDIQINGNSIKEFDRYVSAYTYRYPEGQTEPPQIKATASDKYQVSVSAEAPYEKPVIVTVTDKNEPSRLFRYSIEFKMVPAPVDFEEFKSVWIDSYTVSDEPQAENPGSAAFDGDLETRWAAAGDATVNLDLASPQYLDGLVMAFWKGNVRQQKLNIQVSLDGETYTKVFDGMSSGTTESYEKFMFNRVEAQYVRVTLGGTTEGSWNSLNELLVIQERE